MNKKIIALVATLFAATSAQAHFGCERTLIQSWPEKFERAETTTALAAACDKANFYEAFKNEKAFEQKVQTAVLTSAAVVAATVFGCVFAEWLQEFKVRKAEKAKLIARLKHETRNIHSASYVS